MANTESFEEVFGEFEHDIFENALLPLHCFFIGTFEASLFSKLKMLKNIFLFCGQFDIDIVKTKISRWRCFGLILLSEVRK